MSDIKKCFTSRFGDDGVIMEGDWSQLEVVGQAFLAGDENMKQDIRDGIDFHCKRLAFKLKKLYEEVYMACHTIKDPTMVKLRRGIKEFSFQRAYGASANAIAESTGMSVSEVKDLIAQEEEMYPDLSKYYDAIEEEVYSTRQPTSRVTELGYPSGEGRYKSVTGREYWFKEYDAPKFMRDRGHYTSFSMPQMMNYPVQGFATGDLVPLVLGKLYRKLNRISKWRGKVFLINTVHDSIILDVHRDIVTGVSIFVKNIMEEGGKYLNETFDIDFDLPLRAEVSWGPSWGEMTNGLV